MFQNTSVFEWKKVLGVPHKKNPDIKPNKMEYQL